MQSKVDLKQENFLLSESNSFAALAVQLATAIYELRKKKGVFHSFISHLLETSTKYDGGNKILFSEKVEYSTRDGSCVCIHIYR